MGLFYKQKDKHYVADLFSHVVFRFDHYTKYPWMQFWNIALPKAAKERTDNTIQYAGPHSLDPVHIDVKKLQTGHDDKGEKKTQVLFTNTAPVPNISLFTNKKLNSPFLLCVSATVVPDVEADEHGKEEARRQ